MTRQSVLSKNGRFNLDDPSEYYRPAIRDQKALEKFSRLLEKTLGEKAHFHPNTELALKVACAQYLGRFPCETPSDSDIRRAIGEMQRMHGSWKNGFGLMETSFRDMRRIMDEVEKYAETKGLLPKPR